jgi:hypothetical protein
MDAYDIFADAPPTNALLRVVLSGRPVRFGR